MITWEENNPFVYIARLDGKYIGMVSQSPDSNLVMNPGKWTAAIHTASSGIECFGPFDTKQEAVDLFLGETYKQPALRLP
jgi:hypothetical protein